MKAKELIKKVGAATHNIDRHGIYTDYEVTTSKGVNFVIGVTSKKGVCEYDLQHKDGKRIILPTGLAELDGTIGDIVTKSCNVSEKDIEFILTEN